MHRAAQHDVSEGFFHSGWYLQTINESQQGEDTGRGKGSLQQVAEGMAQLVRALHCQAVEDALGSPMRGSGLPKTSVTACVPSALPGLGSLAVKDPIQMEMALPLSVMSSSHRL